MISFVKKLIVGLLLLPFIAAAQTTTTSNIGLEIPGTNAIDWQVQLNYNWNRLDQLMSANLPIPALTVTGQATLPQLITWQFATNYSAGQVVVYLGTFYTSLSNGNSGNLPTNTTYWSNSVGSSYTLPGDVAKTDTANSFSALQTIPLLVTPPGAQLTAASTVTLTAAVHHITGTTPIETFVVPTTTTAGWHLNLIADSAGVNLGTTGNIAVAATLAVNQSLELVWDGTKFYPATTPPTSGGSSGMTLISTQVADGSGFGVTFSSIPQSFTNLELRILAASASGPTTLIMRFNGDSSGNYNSGYTLNASGTVTGNGTNGADAICGLTGTTAYMGSTRIAIPGYSSTTLSKSFVFDSFVQTANTPTVSNMQGGGSYTNGTSAITEVDIYDTAGQIAAGSIFSLYGLQ